MEQNKKINIVLILLFILLIITISLILINPTKKPNQYSYNGFLINKYRLPSAPDVEIHQLETYIGNHQYSIPMRNDPRVIELIPVIDLDQVSWLSQIQESNNYIILAKQIFLTFDPEKLTGADTIIAIGEVGRILGTADYGIYKIPTTGAFTKVIQDSNTPIKTCNDANIKTGIITFQLGDSNKVYTENDCVIVQGKDYDGLIKSSDRLLLALLGVIENSESDDTTPT